MLNRRDWKVYNHDVLAPGSCILVVVASGETQCLMFRKHINGLNYDEKSFESLQKT